MPPRTTPRTPATPKVTELPAGLRSGEVRWTLDPDRPGWWKVERLVRGDSKVKTAYFTPEQAAKFIGAGLDAGIVPVRKAKPARAAKQPANGDGSGRA